MRYQRADDQAFGKVVPNAFKFGNFFDVDQSLGLIKPLLHENGDMSSAGKDFGLARMLFKQRTGLSNRRRFQIIEVFQSLDFRLLKVQRFPDQTLNLER